MRLWCERPRSMKATLRLVVWCVSAGTAGGLSNLHARNRHRGGYDIARLSEAFPMLKPHVVAGRAQNTLSVDFAKPEAVEALNAALLSVDYGVRDFTLPAGHLCPAVPGRADYLHVMADLLAQDTQDRQVPRDHAVRVLDVGVGASCIYPLIGHAEYGWSFIASDVSQESINSADAIITANSVPVELRLQPFEERVLAGVLQPDDGCLAFTMCNPPFYASPEEAAAAASRKWRGLRKAKGSKGKHGSNRSFGGSSRELWCHGGERRFVSAHIRESSASPHAALWFSSLVSSERSMPKLIAELSSLQPAPFRIEQLGVATGNKAMRVLAWSFFSNPERRERLAAACAGTAVDGRISQASHQESLQPFQRRMETLRAQEVVGLFMKRRQVWLGTIGAALGSRPTAALADLAAPAVPLVGRFEKLSGANAFIGSWTLYSTNGPEGALRLMRDGDVELRGAGSELLGTSVAPWTYRSIKKGESTVFVSFSLDVSSGEFDVLYFEGMVDATAGPARRLEGSMRTGNGRLVGTFLAVPS